MKIEIASEIITELVNLGFKFELVLADSIYGESSLFISTLDEFKLHWVKHNNKSLWGLDANPSESHS